MAGGRNIFSPSAFCFVASWVALKQKVSCKSLEPLSSPSVCALLTKQTRHDGAQYSVLPQALAPHRGHTAQWLEIDFISSKGSLSFLRGV